MSGRRMQMTLLGLAILVIALVGWGAARRLRGPVVTPAMVDAAIAASWTHASPDGKARLRQDATQRECTEARNKPSPELAQAIQAREARRIVYPQSGRLVGDWQRGQALAESGYGGRFTDTDTSKPNGGNCYACHQLAPAEISYGTLGPPLTGYGRLRKDVARAVYDHVFDSNALVACSRMPRFGAAGVLTPEQIADIVAYVVSPDSPVNR